MNNFGFLRTAVVCPDVVPGDVEKNTKEICSKIEELKKEGVQLAVFPELCITGYTCGDLFGQKPLLLPLLKFSLIHQELLFSSGCLSAE